MKPWQRLLALGLAVAVLAHLLAVWAAPRLIMREAMSRIAQETAGQPAAQAAAGVYLPPPTDHTQRRIVMPSPDLLYATCAFDLREGPLRIRMASGYPRYWSIALYASSTDNFFVVNDRKTAGQDIDLTLVGPRQADTASPGEVISPTERGFLLLRLLVNDDPEVRAAAEATRRTLRCDRGRA